MHQAFRISVIRPTQHSTFNAGGNILTMFCEVDRENVNIFCSSKLWTCQLVSGHPKAIQEQAFVVPGAGTGSISSAEGRRNYTDVQETAQWLGGVDFPLCVLKDLLNRFFV